MSRHGSNGETSTRRGRSRRGGSDSGDRHGSGDGSYGSRGRRGDGDHRSGGKSRRSGSFSRRLSRDPSRGRIGGVCAGIAKHFAAETWVVRCIAVTGLLFFPSLVFPAYWILYFLMGPPSGKDDGHRPRDNGRYDHTSPAPEFGPQLSPRRSLRNVRADLAQVELRLRRMERHVTSGQYELQRELNKLDGAERGTS